MSKNHKWNYSEAKNQKVGTMVCTACSKLIEVGQYRYRETPNSYLAQHRSCSEADIQWSKLDNRKATYLANLEMYLEECIAFSKKWNTSTLDDDIEITQEYLQHNKQGV